MNNKLFIAIISIFILDNNFGMNNIDFGRLNEKGQKPKISSQERMLNVLRDEKKQNKINIKKKDQKDNTRNTFSNKDQNRNKNPKNKLGRINQPKK